MVAHPFVGDGGQSALLRSRVGYRHLVLGGNRVDWALPCCQVCCHIPDATEEESGLAGLYIQ